MRQVTSGDFDVTAYYGCEPVSGVHYFQSTVSGAKKVIPVHTPTVKNFL